MKKRLLTLVCLLLLIAPAFGQQLDFKVKVDTVKSLGKTALTLTVNVNSDDAGIEVYYMTNSYSKGGKVIAYAEKLSSHQFLIKNITESMFYVCVSDNKESIVCKKNYLFK